MGKGEGERRRLGCREQLASLAVRELDLRARLFLARPGLPSQQQQGLWLWDSAVFTAHLLGSPWHGGPTLLGPVPYLEVLPLRNDAFFRGLCSGTFLAVKFRDPALQYAPPHHPKLPNPLGADCMTQA